MHRSDVKLTSTWELNMRRAIPPIYVLAVFIALSIVGPLCHTKVGLAQPITAPLIQKSDLAYVGAFRVPPGMTVDANSLNYGKTSLKFNPAHNSLFTTGYDPQQYSAELQIPTL